jgi:hypothetical protein
MVALTTLLACGGKLPTGRQETRRVSSFSGALDDPTKCTCNDGMRTFTVRPSVSGHLDAIATVQPADAHLMVRLVDSDLDTVVTVSTQQGATARLGFGVSPATYVVQVFLASDGPRQATFRLDVTYPYRRLDELESEPDADDPTSPLRPRRPADRSRDDSRTAGLTDVPPVDF